MDSESGLLVPPNDPGRLAEALLGLLMNARSRRGRLPERGRRRAQEPPIERRAARLRELLEKRAKG